MGLFDKIADGIGKGLSNAAGNAVRNVAERKATEVATDQLGKLADKAIPTGGANGGSGSAQAVQNGGAYTDGCAESGTQAGAVPAQNAGAQVNAAQYAQAGAFLGGMMAGAAQYAQSPEYQKMLAEQKQREIDSRVPVESDAAFYEKWARMLPQFPAWRSGGYNAELSEGGLDERSNPYFYLQVCGASFTALSQYRNLLKQNGFRAAGKYPSDDMLYKMIDGQCYNFESCEPFGGGEGCLSVTFGLREPNGGFDYKKEDGKPKKTGLFGIFRK